MTTVTSVLSSFGSDKAAAAAYLVDSGLPVELCLKTGNSSIEVGNDLIGHKKPFGLSVTNAYSYEYTNEEEEDVTLTGYVLSFSLTCIRQGGKALPYGAVPPKTALAQDADNPEDKPQWFTLNAKVAYEEAPAGAERIFDELVEYHAKADAASVPFATRMKPKKDGGHPVWLTGTVRFQLAAGGKYGLYISALDVSKATFCGSGNEAEPSEDTVLDCVAVEDVSALFGAAAKSSKKTVASSGRRRTTK